MPKFGEMKIKLKILLDKFLSKDAMELKVPPVDEEITITLSPILDPISIASCRSSIQYLIEASLIAIASLP
jgi:hypothetical protein